MNTTVLGLSALGAGLLIIGAFLRLALRRPRPSELEWNKPPTIVLMDAAGHPVCSSCARIAGRGGDCPNPFHLTGDPAWDTGRPWIPGVWPSAEERWRATLEWLYPARREEHTATSLKAWQADLEVSMSRDYRYLAPEAYAAGVDWIDTFLTLPSSPGAIRPA